MKHAFIYNYLHPSRHFLYRINTNKICGHIYLPYNCGNTYDHLKIRPPLFPLQLPFPTLFPASYFLFKTLYVTPGRSYPTKLSTWAKTTIQTELQSLQKQSMITYYKTKRSHCFQILTMWVLQTTRRKIFLRRK